jgi:hypothetical protein
MYENLCGNCVGRIELTFFSQFKVAQFRKLSNQCVNAPRPPRCITDSSLINQGGREMHAYEMSYKMSILSHSHSYHILGDSKLLWPSMAIMYENLCGNCVGRVELTFP